MKKYENFCLEQEDYKMLTRWYARACCEWISSVSWDASARWYMVDNSAFSIYPAYSGTWIHTMQILTCFCAWTICINCAFWPACHIWISKILWDALTCCSPLSISADCILSTWCGVARIYNFCGCKS